MKKTKDDKQNKLISKSISLVKGDTSISETTLTDVKNSVDFADQIEKQIQIKKYILSAIKILLSIIYILSAPTSYYFLIYNSGDKFLKPNIIKNEVSLNTTYTNFSPFVAKKSLVNKINISDVNANVVIVYDNDNKEIIASKNANEKVPMASLTKLMSAIVAVEYFKSTDVLTVQKTQYNGDWELGLKIGDSITFDDALKAGLISSYNDAIYLIAQSYPGGEEAFIEEMNKKAEILDMTNTHYTNPVGFDNDNHYTTANDLIKLLRSYDTYTKLIQYSSLKSDTVTITRAGKEINSKLTSTDDLLDVYSFIVETKTGYTDNAGQCLFIRMEYKNRNITSIVLNAENRFDETEKIIYKLQMIL